MASDSKPTDPERLCDFCETERTRRRLIFVVLTGFSLSFSAGILILIFVLYSSKPALVLQGATVREFNATSSSRESSNPNFLSINMEAALSSLNPNARSGIHYSQLRAYATYRGKEITLPAQLHKSNQGHKDVTDWLPVLHGNMIPVTPDLGPTLAQDLNTGSIPINVKVDGSVKWKVWLVPGPKYQLHVSCPTVLMPKASGIEVQQLPRHCSVKVKLAIMS